MLADEIDALVIALGGIPAPASTRLEREIALLVWTLRNRRMSDREAAIHYNGLALRARFGPKPHYSLHTRIEDLIEELKLW